MPAASAAGVRSSEPALLQAAQLRRALEQLMATYSAAARKSACSWVRKASLSSKARGRGRRRWAA